MMIRFEKVRIYFNALMYLIFIVACMSICYLFKLNLEKDIKINQLSKAVKVQNSAKKDSLLKLIEENRFKEEFYSTQLSIQSDWTIAYVTILFGIFSIIGFSFFVDRINSVRTGLESKFDTEIKKHKEDYDEFKHSFNESKRDIYLLAASNMDTILKMNFKSNIKFLYSVGAAHNYIKAIEFEKDVENIESLINISSKRITNAFEVINTITNKDDEEFINLSNKNGDTYNRLIEIMNFDNKEVKILTAKVLASLEKFTYNNK